MRYMFVAPRTLSTQRTSCSKVQRPKTCWNCCLPNGPMPPRRFFSSWSPVTTTFWCPEESCDQGPKILRVSRRVSRGTNRDTHAYTACAGRDCFTVPIRPWFWVSWRSQTGNLAVCQWVKQLRCASGCISEKSCPMQMVRCSRQAQTLRTSDNQWQDLSSSKCASCTFISWRGLEVGQWTEYKIIQALGPERPNYRIQQSRGWRRSSCQHRTLDMRHPNQPISLGFVP